MTHVLPAPAKINLSLRILRRREDGFHDLSTRMVPLALADEIRIAVASGPPGEVSFSCSDATVPTDDSNLVLKAVRALRHHTRATFPHLKIHLEKRIPHGAGLGGGSSDAATMLRGLNQILSLNLTFEELMSLAAEIGSDVPFFLHGCACDCTGRGEIVTPAPDFNPKWPILLVKLPFGVPTPWAYKKWLEAVPIPGVDFSPQRVEGVEICNDLERPVFSKHFVLADLKTWLREQPEVAAALMSGSGSTVFAILRTSSAKSLIERLQERIGCDVWIAETSCQTIQDG